MNDYLYNENEIMINLQEYLYEAAADEKGIKKSKSNIKTAGARTDRNIDFAKFGDLCKNYLSMIERGKTLKWCFDNTSVAIVAI